MPQTTQIADKQEQRPNFDVMVRFKRTDSFNEDQTYNGSFVKATITIRRPNHDPDWAPDTIPLNRFKRDIESHVGADKFHDDNDDQRDAQVDYKPIINQWDQPRIDIFSETMSLRNLMWDIQSCVNRLRKGDLYLPPKVNTDQHKEMVSFGIKLRKDGLFGYHLRCARGECDRHVKTCYTAVDLHEAIWDINKRRSAWHCSTACFILDGHGGIEDIDPDWNVHSMEKDLADRIEPFCSEVEDEDDCPDVDIKAFHEKDPEGLRLFLGWLMEHADSDYFMSDAGESACET